MKRKSLIMHGSLFAGMLGIVAGGDVCAAIRIGNASRNTYYAQQAAQERAKREIPEQEVQSTNTSVTEQTQSDAKTSDAELEKCSEIYPNGNFAIDRPTAGIGTGGGKTCVAVVELQGYQMGENGKNAVFARANVAAGSTIKCNISEFPEASYTLDAERVTFPADAEPTVEDVRKVMDQEQKQNAALKIAAGTIIGGIGGNLSGKNDVGKDGLLGTSKSQMTGTLIGALGGAAITAGGAYGGKVGGDMILSAGVNAAAGGVVGNIVASGDSVLRIENCEIKGRQTTCLWGYVQPSTILNNDDGTLCAVNSKECNYYYVDLNDRRTVMKCDINNRNCVSYSDLVSIMVRDESKGKDVSWDEVKDKDVDGIKSGSVYRLTDYDKNIKQMESGTSNDSHTYVMVKSAKIAQGAKKPAMIADLEDSAFGRKTEYWNTWKNANSGKAKIYYRYSNGNSNEEPINEDINNFYPMYVGAEDGDIIDLSNKARLKGTLIGAGAGGALGAFTAYQGAQDDIDQRWVSSVREYKDSLQKFYCMTGGRFLSYYNDMVIIPNISE